MGDRHGVHARILLAPLLLASLAAPVSAFGAWALELRGGTAIHVPTRLELDLDGAPGIRMRPRFETRALDAPPYYSVRLSCGAASGAWELELIHDKLYLKDRDRTADLPRFEAVHGYNVITLGRSFRRHGLQWRAGIGAALVALDGTARGAPIRVRHGVFGGSYSLQGPAGQIGVGKPVRLGDRLFLSVEAKAVGAYARVPIEGGRVTVPDVSLHGLLGLGYAF